ncbi:MAG TPA: N-acetyl-gamma-glutamyl-phosphate reductase [Polyangia bacterium]
MHEVSKLRVGIVGVSGYSGMELARILAAHPHFSLSMVTTDKWEGKRLGQFVAVNGPVAELACVSHVAGQKLFRALDLVFFCTPAEASVTLAPIALAAGTRVVDLSGAFRLGAEDYPQWYGFAHGNPHLLRDAVYSMPEAAEMSMRLREAKLVSNPGCYPTASTLAVLPLLRAGLIEPDPIFIDAKSGTTGAGRKGTEDYSFSELADDFRAYRVLRHQHQPEIERVLAQSGAPDARVTFTPHLLPVRRGILASAYCRLRPGVGGSDPAQAVKQTLADFAEGKPFVHIVTPDEVRLRAVVGTNRVLMGVGVDAKRGVVVSIAAIDNLVKGAAGQAVQNANMMFGLPETTGLLALAGHMP